MGGATVQIQCICGGSARPELQCLVFGRATQKISRVRGRRCNFSHMQSWISYVILLPGVHFGDPHTMLHYHAIDHFLCIGCALCKHEFLTLETQKV